MATGWVIVLRAHRIELFSHAQSLHCSALTNTDVYDVQRHFIRSLVLNLENGETIQRTFIFVVCFASSGILNCEVCPHSCRFVPLVYLTTI